MVWASPCIFETEFFCRWCFWALFCTTISSEIHPHPYPTVPLSGLHLVQACECQLLYYLLFKFFIIIHVCEHTVSIKCTTIQSFLSTLLWKWSMNAEKSIWIHPFFQWVMKNSLLLNLTKDHKQYVWVQDTHKRAVKQLPLHRHNTSESCVVLMTLLINLECHLCISFLLSPQHSGYTSRCKACFWSF